MCTTDVEIGGKVQGDGWNRGNSVRSRPALDDARMKVLLTAVQHVETVGISLGVSQDLIDRICLEAGVSAKQFGQVWPSANAFMADLFCELANQAQIDRADTETLLTTWQYLSMRTEDLRTPAGRRSVLIDIIRTAAEYNFEVVTASSKWRTYAALSTTIMAWPDEADRSRMLDALQASELSFVETMESFYRNVLPTVGYRLKPMFHNDYQPFVVAAASVIEGLGIVRATVPALVGAHFSAPGAVLEGEGREAAPDETWSVSALAFMGVVDAFIEPDPEFVAAEAISRLSSGVDVTPQSPGADTSY
ncbi:hypothetical protein SAMN04488565_2431 [Leucobacter chromiiresistens]|uniref:HTH tetR-type domain-containing protein n=2 Tax=Leucobacter chromiiresistens TaxID=1079994 RepID=A0A1H1A8S2_9MICO|nr:hypothetical protein SAMN04488565_2431 [Leucobacter chromiiresistens]